MTDAGAVPAPGSLPVTVVLSRHPAPGREADLVAWAHGVSEAAADFPGHLGAVVYPPSPPDCDDLVIAFSFASAQQLSAWERSAVRRDWLERSRELVVGEMTLHAASGFEGIFAHGPAQPVVPPPRWKTAVVIALALYPMSLLLAWLLAPRTVDWSIWLRVALNVALIVPYMAWVGVPFLTRRLRGWLHA